MRYVYEPHPVVALAGAGLPFNGGTRGIWVDCIRCPARGRLPDAGPETTDDEARERFVREGWTVEPTVCPAHKDEVTADG